MTKDMKLNFSVSLLNEKWLMFLLWVLFFLPLIILGFSHFEKPNEISLLDQLKTNPGYVESNEPGQHLVFGGSHKEVEVSINIPIRVSQSHKIKIDYIGSKNLKAIKIVIPEVAKKSYRYRHLVRIVDNQSGSLTFGLNDTNARYLTLVLYGNPGKNRPTTEITISSLSVAERTFIDSNLYYILLMLCVSSSLVLIGMLSGSFLQKICRYSQNSSAVFMIVGVFAYSIILLLTLLLFQRISTNSYNQYFLLSTATLTSLLIYYVYKYKLMSTQHGGYITSVKVPVLLYLFFSAIVAFVVGSIDGIALQEYYWTLIGKYRMFGGHGAHDNAFQYLNAVAIAENKPFNYFYKAPQLARHLMFGVEDRQVMMGAILGVYRVLWGHISIYLANSYGFFIIIGSCFSLLIIFPLYGFFRRYFERYIVVLSIILLFMGTYVLGNIYYTWFKILGGGCVLAGIYFLHFHTEYLKSWVIAGILLGIAVNMHTGQAIVYPLIAIYFFYQYLSKCTTASFVKAVTYTFTLTFVVVIAMLPWEIIKHYYFPNESDLFRLHFLHGQRFSESMLQTIINFFSDRYTFSEQLAHRSEQLVEALRINDITAWYSNMGIWDLKRYLFSWNKLQFRYITIMVYPLLIMLSITVYSRKFVCNAWTKKRNLNIERPDLNKLFLLSFCCVIWGLLVMHTKSETISSSFVSQYATLFILMFLHCMIASYSRLGLVLILLYSCISFTKLYVYFSHVLTLSSLL